MPKKIAHYKSFEIGYEAIGSGEAIYLIPGFTEGLSIYHHLAILLSEWYKVISIDIPGTYSSVSLFSAERNWSMEKFADVVLTVANQEKDEKICVMGHSMGGYIALTITAIQPERLTGLGLIHSTGFPDTQEKIEFRLKSIDFIKKHGSDKFIEQVVNGLYSETFKKNEPDIIKNHLNAAKTIKDEVLIAHYQAMMFRADHSETLRKFNKPVLFIAGEEDNSVPLKDTLKQCTLPKISQISILKKTGHSGFVEQPEKVASILRNYCQLVFSI